jgi:hypothetical protein
MIVVERKRSSTPNARILGHIWMLSASEITKKHSALGLAINRVFRRVNRHLLFLTQYSLHHRVVLTWDRVVDPVLVLVVAICPESIDVFSIRCDLMGASVPNVEPNLPDLGKPLPVEAREHLTNGFAGKKKILSLSSHESR